MVLDGIVSTIVGIIGFALMVKKFAPTQVIDVVNFPNSVNPKSLRYGNTEPSVKACVETGRGTSLMDEGTVRTTKKFVEPFRNVWPPAKQVVTELRLHRFHEHLRHDHDGHSCPGLYPHSLSYSHFIWSACTMPVYEVIHILNFPNSVKAKAYAMPIPSQA